MKNTSLALFAVVVLLGWTALAASVIATFAGQPGFTSRAHTHHQHIAPVQAIEQGPLLSSASPR